jgi:FtsP/CotA-like multicopper oxidase with cupredoxin domain
LVPLGVVLGIAAALWVWAAGSSDHVVPVTPAGAGTATSTPTPAPGFSTPLNIPPVITSANPTISMEEACIQIRPGPCTNMWTYGGTFPGPTIRRPTGEPTYVTFTNNLPATAGEMTVHHHGNHSSPENDGQPHHHLIPAGQSLMYTYEHMEDGEPERGATQWYHDHRMDVTGRNVWNGLAGMYILDDPADPATLPSGPYEVPLMIMDRQFDVDNQIPYFFSVNGAVGPTQLVNGVHQPYLEVGDRKYRFRILDAANVRVYDLALTNGTTFTQVGTESGLLPAPIERDHFLISPSERVDVVVDFAGLLGETLYLRDLRSGIDLLQFRVTNDVTDDSSIPATLRPMPDLGEPTVTRTFTFARIFGKWTINAESFDPDRVDAFPLIGSTEKWILKTSSADGGALHAIHIHDVDQQCLTRNGAPCPAYEATKEAWLMQPGDTLEVKLKFSDHLGKYVFHCHFLEHEDDGMMSQFEVVESTPTPSPTATPTPTPTPTQSPTPTETPPPVPDNDDDGVPNDVESACGSDPDDELSLPERVDGAYAGQDEDGDTLLDEPLPGAAAGVDCDGDGYPGGVEGSIYTPATDRDQDPCGSGGWPSNFVDGFWGPNRLEIHDVVSFVSPVRYLGTSPGDGTFNARWDLTPGPSIGAPHIDIADVTTLVNGGTGYPRMFAGAWAFNRTCPWP